MHKRLLLLLALLLTLMAGACSDQDTIEEAPSASLSGHVYDNPLLGIRMTLPSDWMAAIDTVVETEPLLLYANSGGTDSAMSVSLVHNTDLEELTDDPFVAAALVKIGLEQRFADLHLVQSDTVRIDSVPCATIVFESTVHDELKRNRLIYIVHDGSHMILTFTAWAAAFDSHADATVAVIESTELY